MNSKIIEKSKKILTTITSAIGLFIYRIFRILVNIWKKNPHHILVIIIILIAAFLRLYNLSILPGGISESELEVVKKSKDIVESNKIWLGVDFKEGLYLYLSALFVKILGFKILSFRLLSAFIGILTVLMTYLFTKEWFNKQAAYLTGIIMAFSSWHITISRNIDPLVLVPLFIVSIFYFASFAFRSKKLLHVILSGLIFGLSVYVDTSFFILPILLLVAGVYFYFKNKKFLDVYIKEISIVFNIFLFISIPFLISMVKNSNVFFADYKLGSIYHHLANFGVIMHSFFSRSSVDYYYNLGSEALLDPFTGILFFVGLVYVTFNILKSRKNFFLISWFFILIIPAVFSSLNYLGKIVIVLPAIYILAGVILDLLLNNWFKTFPINKKARISMILLVSLFFVLSFSYNYKKYFVAWAGSDNVKQVYSQTLDLPQD